MAELKFTVSKQVPVDEDAVRAVVNEFLNYARDDGDFRMCSPNEEDELMTITKSQKDLLIDQFISTWKGER